MHVILPPSETKRSGGGGVFAPDELSFSAELGRARRTVRSALVRVSKSEKAAVPALKLGVKSRDERLRNLALDTSGAMPAIERYTGVLYDALDVMQLDARERGWIDEHVLIQSALFGLIRAGDPIPAYRMSASSRLPGMKTPLAKHWSAAHEKIDLAGTGVGENASGSWILDLRSLDYVALAPLPAASASYLHVTQRAADGEVRALNHFNKAAKGRLVRSLARAQAELNSPAEFREWASNAGLEIASHPDASTLTLVLPEPDSAAVTLNQ